MDSLDDIPYSSFDVYDDFVRDLMQLTNNAFTSEFKRSVIAHFNEEAIALLRKYRTINRHTATFNNIYQLLDLIISKGHDLNKVEYLNLRALESHNASISETK